MSEDLEFAIWQAVLDGIDYTMPEALGEVGSSIAKELGVSTAKATSVLKRLEAHGLVVDTGMAMRRERVVGGGTLMQYTERPKAEGGMRTKPGASTQWGIPKEVAEQIEAGIPPRQIFEAKMTHQRNDARSDYELLDQYLRAEEDAKRVAREEREARRLAEGRPKRWWQRNMRGGLAEGHQPSEFDRAELARGTEHELEHTDDPAIAEQIAMDHLIEDEGYYEKLDAMERQMFRNAKAQAGHEGTVKFFSLVLSGLLTQYDQAEMRRELKRGGGNIYRLGHLLKAAQEADAEVADVMERSDPEAIERYRQAIHRHFHEFPPTRRLDKMMREWTEQGKRPRYPVERKSHEPNAATQLSGGPRALIAKLASAPPEFARSKKGSEMASKALRMVEQNDPEQADLFLTELTMLGYHPGSALREHEPNAGYYVWLLDSRNEPLSSEGPYGPHAFDKAKSLARIGATEGKHGRAVSLGRDPKSSSFRIVRAYRAGTGDRLI